MPERFGFDDCGARGVGQSALHAREAVCDTTPLVAKRRQHTRKWNEHEVVAKPRRISHKVCSVTLGKQGSRPASERIPGARSVAICRSGMPAVRTELINSR